MGMLSSFKDIWFPDHNLSIKSVWILMKLDQRFIPQKESYFFILGVMALSIKNNVFFDVLNLTVHMDLGFWPGF